MFGFGKKKNGIFLTESCNYEIDKNSKIIIENYMKKNGLDDISIGQLLNMLGFDLNKRLYLKLKQNGTKLMIYYSYEKDNFNKFDYISFDYVLKRYISVNGKNSYRSYFIKWEYPTGKLCLLNENTVITNKIDNVLILCSLYKGEFRISIKNNNTNMEIKLCSDLDKADDEKILKILGKIMIDFNIDFIYTSVVVKDLFKKYINMLNDLEIKFKNMSVVLYDGGREYCGYWLKDNNSKLEYNEMGYDGKMVKNYERSISKKYIDYMEKQEISIILNEFKRDYRVEINCLGDDLFYNEMELIDYLKWLNFPVKLEDICRKISEISFSNLDKYLKFSLKIYYNDLRTDVLSFKEGKLDYFQRVVDGKRVTINTDGVFSYTNGDEISNVSVRIKGDIVTRYEQVSDVGIDSSDDSNRVMYRVINEAKGEKNRVRKLVDELINR